MLYLIRLRKILLSNKLYLVLVIFTLSFMIINFIWPYSSHYSKATRQVTAKVINYTIDGNKLNLDLKAKEKLKASYYFTTKKEKSNFINTVDIGDMIKIKGIFSAPSPNKTPNLFNYKKYLEKRKIYYLIKIEEIYLVRKNKNLFYKLKNFTIKRTQNPYLRTFILGDTTLVSNQVIKNYQEIGISHLFAISGMHISLLSSLILKLLKKLKLKDNFCYCFVSVILCFYLLLVGFSPSVLRAVLFFILFSINKIYYFYIKPSQIFIMVLTISLIINPNYIYDIGFLYSFSISLSLILLGNYINQYENYFLKLLLTSIIAFVVSTPITLYNFNQLNFLSIFYNLIYVPLISIIIFPLSLLSFFLSPLESVLNITTKFLEMSSAVFAKISLFKIIYNQAFSIIYILYVIFIIIFLFGLTKNKYYCCLPFLILLIGHSNYPKIDSSDYIVMLDVGQGDSILLHSNNKNILIDTGGHKSYNKKWAQQKNNYSIVENITIPYLKKRGIKKLDYLFLTHGDYDHLGEALNLVKKFKVEKILINEGHINYLERQIINSFNNVDIAYQDSYYQVGDFKIMSLNYDLKEENDSSLILYVEIRKTKLLFTGDASVRSEEKLMTNYELPTIDFLKVGHHGSDTSSSKEFINTINPKYALISVGINNKYNHPKKSVLKILTNSKIYRTDKNGSIEIKLHKNGYIVKPFIQ